MSSHPRLMFLVLILFFLGLLHIVRRSLPSERLIGWYFEPEVNWRGHGDIMLATSETAPGLLPLTSWASDFGARNSLVVFKFPEQGAARNKGYILHEICHVLKHLGRIKRDLPFATAFQCIDEYQRSNTVFDTRLRQRFFAGLRIAIQTQRSDYPPLSQQDVDNLLDYWNTTHSIPQLDRLGADATRILGPVRKAPILRQIDEMLVKYSSSSRETDSSYLDGATLAGLCVGMCRHQHEAFYFLAFLCMGLSSDAAYLLAQADDNRIRKYVRMTNDFEAIRAGTNVSVSLVSPIDLEIDNELAKKVSFLGLLLPSDDDISITPSKRTYREKEPRNTEEFHDWIRCSVLFQDWLDQEYEDEEYDNRLSMANLLLMAHAWGEEDRVYGATKEFFQDKLAGRVSWELHIGDRVLRCGTLGKQANFVGHQQLPGLRPREDFNVKLRLFVND